MSRVILFEYDLPVDRKRLFNYQPGIWRWEMKPGTVTVTDDYALVGYYEYNNGSIIVFKSVRIGSLFLAEVDSLAECISTEKTYFLDSATDILYIHTENGDPPTTESIFIGVVTGYTLGRPDSYYFNDTYYEPRLKQVSNIKKSKDPLYFGILQYQSGSISAINDDGHYDTWRDLNLFSQPARRMYGLNDTAYHDYEVLSEGFIENDNRDFSTINITIQDQRKSYTQTVDRNLLTQNEYPSLDDNDVDKPRLVAYGQIFNSPSICLNKNESSPSVYNYLICDTEFNPVGSVQDVYVNGVALIVTTDYTVDLNTGIVDIDTTKVTPASDEVTIDFTNTITNGVAILKDLLANYEGLSYISSFWDTTEVNAAELVARNTSLYLDSNIKLKDAIELVCNDIDAIFFRKDNGLFTIRVYDENRTITKTIQEDEWLGEPTITNNGSEYLTSAIIKYRQNRADKTSYQLEDLSFEDTAFNTYKRFKKETFDTGLINSTDATSKANTVLTFSSNVQDIIQRNVSWENKDIEIMDFIIADPIRRVSDIVNRGVYEVLGVQKNLRDFNVQLTLRYVKADPTPDKTYKLLVDELGNIFTDENGNTLAGWD